MNCPNINIKSIRNEFNDIIAAFGGQAMTIEEFRSKDVRNMRSGVDNSAMQIAYYVWDKTNGEGLAALPEYINSTEIDDMQRIRSVVNNMLGVKKGGISSPIVNAEIKAISILQSENADKMFKKGSKNGWTLDKTLNEIGGFSGYKQLFNPEDLLKKVSELGSGLFISNIQIKQGVSEIFESNPELANIGAQEQYSKYLDTIFPDSKVRDIVYHGTNVRFDKFDLKFEWSNEKGGRGKGLNFARDIEDTDLYGDIKVSVLLNAQNRVITDNEARKDKLSYIDDIDEIVVYNPDQIHILGSKQDIEGFKEFIKENAKKLNEQLAIDIASKYGFTVEINTAKEKSSMTKEIKSVNGFSINGDIYDRTTDEDIFGVDDREIFTKNNSEISEKEYRDALYEYNHRTETPTQHYSSLTVPGGTNYTENEISTPLITPSIKGHAQFATDKGIGWFRSDDKVAEGTQPKLTKEEALQRAIEDDRFLPFDTDSAGGIPTKTRRILEMQSDLFQKGREHETLSENKYEIEANIRTFRYKGDEYTFVVGLKTEYLKNDEVITKEEYENANKLYKQDKNKANQFLQLLNKDNNWVTFFIKSIIQDSAKKGYDKVLFPKGETAAKIEGHETIADEIRKYDKLIEDEKIELQNAKTSIKYIASNDVFGYGIGEEEIEFKNKAEAESFINTKGKDWFIREEHTSKESIINFHEDKIRQFEQRKSELKSQGIEKLKPVEAFYEIKVGNILEKQFGKDNVKTITDEFGNQWREVSISPADLDVIKFEKSDESKIPNAIGGSNIKSRKEVYNEYMRPFEKAFDTIRLKFGVIKGYDDVAAPSAIKRMKKAYNDNDSNPFFIKESGIIISDRDYYNQKDEKITITLKDDALAKADAEVEKIYLSQFPDGKAPEIEPISRSEMLKMANEDQNITENGSETQIQPRSDTQLNMLDQLFKFKSNEPGRPSKRSIRVLSKLADRLYNRFGIKYKVVSEEEAVDIVKMADKRSMNEDQDLSRTKGFYDSRTKTAYLIVDRFDSNTTVHEIFGHPFLDIIKSTPELRPLYNQLAIEAAKDADVMSRVDRLYEKHKDIVKADEAILYAMKKHIDGMAESGAIKQLMYRFYEVITDFLNKAFGKSDFIKSIRPTATLESISRWAMFGTDKVSLIGGQQGQSIESAMKSISDKFKGIKFDSSERSIVSFDDMMRIAGLECAQCIFETAEESGITTSDQIIELVRSRLRHTNFVNSSIRNQDGSIAATFKWHTDGNVIYIDAIQTSDGVSMTAAIMSILNGVKDRQEKRIAILSNQSIVDVYNSMSNNLMLTPMSHAIIKLNGVDHLVINKNVAEYNGSIMFEKALVSSSRLSEGEIANFIKETSDGLKSQLKEMERRGTFSVSDMEKVKSVINDIENLSEVEGIFSFVDHAGTQVYAIHNRLKDLKEAMLADDLIDQTELQTIKTNFFSLYKHAIKAISSIRLGSNMISKLPRSDQERFDAALQYVSDNMREIELDIESLSRYAYANEMAKIGLKVGSTTLNSNIDEIYNENSDITTIGAFVFGLSKSPKEPLRALSKIVGDVKAQVAMEMEVGEFGRVFNELTDLWKKIKSKDKFANYDRIMEKSGGKPIGFLISDLLYGKFRHEYKKFREELQVKYRLRNQNDRPIDKKEYYAYMDELNEWLSEHAERRFKPEYYKAKAKLSIQAREALEAANDAISSFLKRNDLLDDNGRPATEKMTSNQKKAYKNLKKVKTALAMDRNPDGTPKLEGSEAWNIAKELSDFNETIASNVKYKANLDGFKAKYEEMKKSLTAKEFATWEKDNLRVQYKKEFWDAMEKADMTGQSTKWQNAYNERAAILKMYRDSDTFEVSAEELDTMEYMDPNTGKMTTLGERVKYLDVWLSDNKTVIKGKKSTFSLIAESVPTSEYRAMEEEALAANDPNVYEEFIKKTSYPTIKGKLVRYSQYSKIEPIDKSLIEIVPNSMWSELDPESNFANPEYLESLAEDGMQPKRSMYDNKKAYDDVMSDPDWALFRNKIREAYKLANSKYTYLPNPNSLQLAQIPGGFLRRAFAYDNILRGLWTAIADNFIVRSYDSGFGDYESRGAFRADGSPTMFVPTRYRTLLDNPKTISRDVLGSLALYAKSAINYKLMTKQESAISTLLDGIASTRVQGSKAGKAIFVRPGETKMYKAAREYVESNVYDRTANPYDIFIPSRKNPDYQYRIAAAKPIIKFMNYVRKVNLSFNVRAFLTNWIGGELHMKIESNLGSAISKQSMRFANYEFARHLPESMGSTINRSNDKLISLMRLFMIARSNEADMKGLHGSKLTNFIASNIHYGPYSAGDFAVKGRMMIAYLANIKLYEGKFYTRDQFANTFYPNKRSEGYDIFDNIQENLYGAFEIGSDGMLGIKEAYKDIVNEEMILNASSAMNVLARKLDGTMSGAEKTRMHTDAFAQALLLHRGWLLNAISERFHSKIYDYEKQMLISGMYSKENFSTAFRMMAMFVGQKISDVRHLNAKGIVSGKLGSIEDRFESGQVYQAKRIMHELGMLMTLSLITTLLGRMVPLDDDDPDKTRKDEDTWQMWAYILSLRSAMEFFALYSPGDVYGIIGNPTAAEGSLNNISDMFGMVFDGSYDDVIESGRYKYKTKLHRSIIKAIPGYKQYYENFVSPDLGAIEKFNLENLPGTFGLFDKIVNPDTDAEKRAKKIRKFKLKIREAKEKARKEAGLD